jgi:uncharacterized protein
LFLLDRIPIGFESRYAVLMSDQIRYDVMVQEALRGVVRKVLTDTVRDGLTGDHHYYISFATGAPNVRMSARLREKYPKEMTIVLQHQFWDLGVTDHTFEVGLSFDRVPERLLIPFEAITGFFDPSVQFGLKFEVLSDEEPDNDTNDDVPEAEATTAKVRALKTDKPRKKPALAVTGNKKNSAGEPDADENVEQEGGAAAPPVPETGASIVSLDSFRKKK